MKVEFRVDNLKSMNSQLAAFADYLRAQEIADEDVFFSRLVSCELISNVIRHGGEAAEFCGELLLDKIAITVTAPSLASVQPSGERPDVFAESGRGLYIINAVSVNGIIREGEGTFKVYVKRTPVK